MRFSRPLVSSRDIAITTKPPVPGRRAFIVIEVLREILMVAGLAAVVIIALTFAGQTSLSELSTANSEFGDEPERSVEPIHGLKASYDGRLIASISRDASVSIHDLQSGTSGHFLLPVSQCSAVGVSPDGLSVLVGAHDGSLSLTFDPLLEESRFREIGRHETAVDIVSYSGDGRWAATGSWDGELRIWSTDRWEVVQAFNPDPDGLKHAIFMPDGRTCVTAGRSASIHLWNFHTGEKVRTIENSHGAHVSIAVSRDGQQLISAGRDGDLRLWDLDSGRLLWMTATSKQSIYAMEFTPDGQSIVVGGLAKAVNVLNAANGNLVARLEGHTDCVSSLLLTDDARQLFTGSYDGTIRVWDFDSGSEYLRLTHGATRAQTAVDTLDAGRGQN